MAWLLIGLVVWVVVLTLIHASSIEDIWALWVLGYLVFVVVGMFLLSIGVPIYSEKLRLRKNQRKYMRYANIRIMNIFRKIQPGIPLLYV